MLLSCTDHESRMTAREIVRELSRRGRLPDFRFELPPGSAAADAHLPEAAAADPAAVLIVATADDAAHLTRAVREELGAVPIFGSHAMGRRRFLELAGPAAEGVRFPLLFAPAGGEAARFVARFTASRGHAPDYTAALAYDATCLLVEAVRQAGPNRARVREALTQLSPWPGIAGAIRFDGTGQNRRAEVALGAIRNGAVVPVSPAAPAASVAHHPSP